VNNHFISNLQKKIKSIKISQNILIFGFFLLVSSVFWFFNALNQEYYTDLHVPVKYINIPDNRLQTGKSTNYISVKISAYGYKVIDYKASIISPVLIDLKQRYVQAVPGSKSKIFYILTSSIRDEISNVLGPDFNLNNINPDTLFIELVKVVSKKVPVVRDFEIGFRKQFMLRDSVQFSPDSVTIKGLESIIDTINEIKTVDKILEDVHDSLRFGISLKKIDGAELSNNKVVCLIPAEEYTELEFKSQVSVLNEPPGYSVKLFPSEVKIVFNVGFSNYQEITSDQFHLVADYQELNKSNNSRILIKIQKMPDKVSKVRIYPQSLDYIIEKND
jgi:hypothetical protein